jgi:hypothetical protein
LSGSGEVGKEKRQFSRKREEGAVEPNTSERWDRPNGLVAAASFAVAL